MTEISGTLRNHRVSVALTPNLGALRITLIFSVLASCFLWPYSGLTAWHLIFFIILSVALYYSYSRYVISLIVYLTMMLIYWVIVPVFQIRTGVGYYTSRFHVPDFGPEALTFVMIHILGIFIGFRLNMRSQTSHRNSDNRFSVVGIFLSFSVLLTLIVIVGYETITLPRIYQGISSDASSYILFFENVTKLFPAILMTYFVLESNKGLRHEAKVPLFMVLVLMIVIIGNPINTARFISLYGILVILLSYAMKVSALRMLAWLILLSPLYTYFVLAATSMLRSGLGSVSITKIIAAIKTTEFSSYSIFLDALKIDTFTQSNYLISHLLIFVPRTLWPGKAESIGVFVAERSGYVYHNVGLNSFFNSFADYGLLGLFLTSVVFGCLARNLNPVVEKASFRSRRFMYGVFFIALSPMVFRGDLSTVMIAFYATVLAYEMTMFLTKFRVH